MDYLDTTGRIFDIQRYSIHDGPGIRTIVFLKGCVLRCQWCSNPESQKYDIQEMIVGGRKKIIGRDVTVREVMKDVMKDEDYYRTTGGGLTLSGGECLCQADFSAALLRAAKENGITTAIESAATLSYDKIEKLLPYLDTYLMDIKHTNPEKHEKFTGRRNEIVLENAMKVARSGQCELIVRVPVIPGFNNTPEEISGIATFAATLPGVKEIDLLPYHRLGQDKYTGLGREYKLDGIPPMEQDYLEKLLKVAERSGLKCQLGG